MSNSRLQGFAIPASSLFLVLLLAACGSKPALPPLQKQITALGEAGHKAYARGDLAGARRDFERALNVAQGGDDADGIAMNRLNLARVAQARGDSAQAHRELDYVLDPLAAPPMGNSWRADAAARKAILLLDADNVEAAGTLVTQAQSWCNKSCPAAATVANLQARIALAARHYEQALAFSAQGLALAQQAKNTPEEANAHRVAGQARLGKGESALAVSAFTQALEADKLSGRPERIYADLMLLGETSARLGRAATASEYFRRAAQVASAENMTAHAAQANKRAEYPASNATNVK